MADQVRKGRSLKGDRSTRVLRADRYPTGDAHYARCQPERLARGTAYWSSRFTAEQVPDVRQLSESGLSGREIARRYGVDSDAVYRILHGKTYADVS